MTTSKNNRFREVKLGKIGLVMLIAGFGVLVFASFLLGVNVGRDIDNYPEKIARGIPRQLAEIFTAAFSGNKKEKESKPQEDGALGLTFYKALTEKGTDTGELLKDENREAPAAPAVIMAPGTPAKPAGPAAAAAAAPGAPAPPAAPSPLPSAPAAGTPPVHNPAAKVVPAGKTPAMNNLAAHGAQTEKKSAAVVLPPAAPGTDVKKKPAGAFIIQVVSYHERDKAGQLKKKLQGLGYAAEIVETDIPGKGKWYRVTVNGYRTRKDAEKSAVDMSSKVKGLNCVIRTQEAKN